MTWLLLIFQTCTTFQLGCFQKKLAQANRNGKLVRCYFLSMFDNIGQHLKQKIIFSDNKNHSLSLMRIKIITSLARSDPIKTYFFLKLLDYLHLRYNIYHHLYLNVFINYLLAQSTRFICIVTKWNVVWPIGILLVLHEQTMVFIKYYSTNVHGSLMQPQKVDKTFQWINHLNKKKTVLRK